jgi:hypothetical protein
MPDYSQLLIYNQAGPSVEATSYVGLPVVGATTTFRTTVSREGNPINNATVTVKVTNSSGNVVYPLPIGSATSGVGTVTVPRDLRYNGSYMITPTSLNIFTIAGGLYEIEWNISVPSNVTYPVSVLPVRQQVIAQSP